MVTIIMTDVISPYGKYTKFTKRGESEIIAEVDRRNNKYLIFSCVAGEIGSRTNKDSALRFAQDYIRGFIPEVEFKWNVMREIHKLV